MQDRSSNAVLAILGDPDLAGLLRLALSHPAITVDLARTHKQITDALAARSYRLIIAGSGVGRRGPLALGDALRMLIKDVPQLIVYGLEIDEVELDEHQRRALPNVFYQDLSGLISDYEHGAAIRAKVLDVLALPDDRASDDDWQRRLRDYAAETRSEDNAPEAVSSEEPSASSIDASATAVGLAPPLIPGPVTDEDVAFARRIAVQFRGVDFRAPIRKRPASHAAEHATDRLRENLRQLTHDLARLAHVYQGRMREFDRADRRIKAEQEQRQRLEEHLKLQQARVAEVEQSWRRDQAEYQAQVTALTRRLDRSGDVIRDLMTRHGDQIDALAEHQRITVENVNRVAQVVELVRDAVQARLETDRVDRRAVLEQAQREGAAVVDHGRPSVSAWRDAVRSVSSAASVESDSSRAGSGKTKARAALVVGVALIAAVLWLARDRIHPGAAVVPASDGHPASTATTADGPSAAQGSLANEATQATDRATLLRGQAMEAAEQRRWRETVELLGQLRAIRPLDATESLTHADAQRRLGRMQQAEQEYWAFIEHFPDDPRMDRTWLWLADVLTKQNRLIEAIDICDMLAGDASPSIKIEATKLRQKLLTARAAVASDDSETADAAESKTPDE